MARTPGRSGGPVGDAAGSALLRQLVLSGGVVGPVAVVVTGTGRGLVTTAPVRQGAILLTVPPTLHLSALRGTAPAAADGSAVGLHPEWGPAARAAAARWPEVAAAHRAAALLDLGLGVGADPVAFGAGAVDPGALRPWLATLPTALDHLPIFYPPDRAAALAGTSLPPLLAARVARLAEEWAWLRAEVPTCADLRPLTWAVARAWVTSRAFDLGAPWGLSLVPALDLLDHTHDAEALWHLGGDGTVVVQAARALPAGAPVRHDYGARSNLRWLLHYGFTQPPSACDETLATLPCGETLRLGHPGVETRGPAPAERPSAEPSALPAAAPVLRAALKDRAAALRQAAPPPGAAFADARRLWQGERAVVRAWVRRLVGRA